MPSITELRQALGTFADDKSDEQLLRMASDATGQSPNDIAGVFGYGSAGGQTSQRFGSSIDSYQAGLYGFGEGLAGAVGADDTADWFRKRRESNQFEADVAAQRAQAQGAVDRWADVHGASDFGNYLVGLGIQSLPYAGEALAGGIVGRGLMTGTRAALGAAEAAGDVARIARARRALNIGSTVGGTAASYPSSVGDILGNQMEQSGRMDFGSAAALGVPYAALNALGLEGALERRSLYRAGIDALDDVSGWKGNLARAGVSGARAAGEEAINETGQEFMNQFGRMAVDPNETFYNDKSAERFKESAIGGLSLGGIFGAAGGGWRRSTTVDDGQFNLTQNPNQQQQLGIYGQDQQIPLQDFLNQNLVNDNRAPKGYAGGFNDAFNEPSGQFASDENGIERELTLGEVLQRNAGVLDGGATVAEKQQLGKTPTVSTFDEIDQGLTDMGISMASGKKTREKQRAFYSDAVATGIPLDSDLLTPYWTAVSQNRFGDKTKVMLQNAIVAHKKEQSNGTAGTTAAVAAQGSVGGSTNNAPSVAPAGSAAPVVGANSGNAVVPGVGSLPVSPVADGAGKPVTTVDTQNFNVLGRTDPSSPFEVLYDEDQNKLEIAKLTGQGAVADAIEQEAEGSRADGEPLNADAKEAILNKRFEKSKDAARDRQIFDAFFVASEHAPQKSVGGVKDAVGADFGIGRKAVDKIGNPKELVRAGQELGYTEAQVREAFGLGDGRVVSEAANSQLDEERTALNKSVKEYDAKLAALGARRSDLRATLDAIDSNLKDATDEEKGKLSEQRNVLSKQLVDLSSEILTHEDARKGVKDTLASMATEAATAKGKSIAQALQQNGIDWSEGESAGFSDDANRLWQKESSSGNEGAEDLLSLGKTIEGLRETIARLEEKGLTNAANAVRGLLDAQQAKVDEAIAAAQPAKAAAPKRVVSDELAAAKQKFKDAKQDVTKMEPAELQLLRGEAEKFKNKALLDKIDAQLGAPTAATEEAPATKAKVEYPSTAGHENAPSYMAPAQRAVVDFMNGEMSKQQLLDKFAELNMTEGQIRSVTNRIDITKDEIDSVKAAREQATAVMTPQEKYAEAVKGFPAPAWDELTKLQQDRVTDLAHRDQLNLAAVNTLLSGTPVGKTNKMTHAFKAKDNFGNTFAATRSTVDTLLGHKGFARAVTLLHRAGNINAFKAVKNWYITKDAVNWDAIYTMVDGQPAVVFSAETLRDNALTVQAMLHEVGHAAEEVHNGGTLSSKAELDSVLDEVTEHMAVNDDFVTETLQYPLHPEDNADLSDTEKRQELFAQLWMISNLEGGMDYLRQNLPVTAEFMENAHAAVQAAKFGNQAAESGQVQGGAKAESIHGWASKQTAAASERAFQNSADSLKPKFKGPLRSLMLAIKDAGAKSLDHVVFTNDLIDRAVNAGMKSAKTFKGLLIDRATKVRELEREVERIADMYALVPEKDRGGERSVNQFLFESTRQGKWGYANGNMKADPEMSAWFDSLDSKSQDFIKAVFKHGDTVLAQKKATVMKYTETEYDARIAAETDPKAKAELEKDKKNSLKRFERLFKIREGLPYAPIKRAGNYVVVAKSKAYLNAERAGDQALMAKLEDNEDHYQVSFTDTKWEARRMAETLAADGRYENSGEGVYLRERDKHQDYLYGGDGVMKSLSKLRTRLEGSEDKASGKLLSMVSDLYLEAMAENSSRKSEMRRRGIAGDVDMIASFAKQGRGDANFMGSVQYGQKIQDALQAMTKEAHKARDDGRASELRNELVARYAQSLDRPQTPWLNRLTRTASLYYLAMSPAYYMQNLTQPWMMSIPAMTGNHGWGEANSALVKAYGELGGVIGSGKLLKQNFDLSKVPEDVRAVIQELANRGKIDIGIESEMGEFSAEGKGKVSSTINKIDKGLRLAVQKVETINRLSTAIAAYRLELAKTKDAAKALDYADRILTETHGDYTGFNAPRAFNTATGKVALQFRKFQLIQLTYYAKLLNQMFTKPGERAAAMKMLGFSLAHTALFAGVRGLPGFAALAWVAAKLLGNEDEPYDMEADMRNAIGDKQMANLILRGAPTLAGLDISGKVGSGTMLSVLPFSNADLTTSQGRSQAVGELFMGASGGMVSRMADGMGMLATGDYYRGLEALLPKGLGDPIKAYREATGGMTRRNGDIMLDRDEISTWETIWGAMGVQSADKAVAYEQRQRVYEMDTNFRDRSTKIKNQYTRAMRDGDSEAAGKARDAWMHLQQTRVENGYTRQPMSELLKAPQAQMKRERQTIGGAQYKKDNRRFVEGQV